MAGPPPRSTSGREHACSARPPNRVPVLPSTVGLPIRSVVSKKKRHLFPNLFGLAAKQGRQPAAIGCGGLSKTEYSISAGCYLALSAAISIFALRTAYSDGSGRWSTKATVGYFPATGIRNWGLGSPGDPVVGRVVASTRSRPGSLNGSGASLTGDAVVLDGSGMIRSSGFSVRCVQASARLSQIFCSSTRRSLLIVVWRRLSFRGFGMWRRIVIFVAQVSNFFTLTSDCIANL